MIEAKEKIKNCKDQIESLVCNITKETDKNKKKSLYEKLLELDNVNEDYSFSYLKFLFKERKEDFKENLLKLEVAISDENLKFFGITERKNSKTKIIEYIEFLRNTEISSVEGRRKFFYEFYKLFYKEKNILFESKKEITWNNKELYLHNLYIFFIDSTNKKIIDYTDSINEKMEDFLDSQFYGEYLKNLVQFLNKINKNFSLRFKNFELEKDEDKLLFEEYIQFLGSYDFSTDLLNITHIWNETFVPLTQKQKIKLVSQINEFNSISYNKISYDSLSSEIRIQDEESESEIIIKDEDNYAFYPLVKSLAEDINDLEIEWSRNKFLKPGINNKNNLLVCKTKNIWGKLLIKILNSKTYTEARNNLYDSTQINFFSLEDLITKIIDDISFISYKTFFFGYTCKNTLKIYEKGLFNKQINKKSIALLKFYSFIIITNIHEIGGNINDRLQYYYNSKDFQKSPDISKNNNKYKFSKNGKSIGRESGEYIEILLFGKILNHLTVKESLYVLNIENYSQNLENFRNNFQKCEDITMEELLSNNSLKELLNNLDINPEDITEQDNNKYGGMDSIKKDEDNDNCLVAEMKHPYSFYQKDSSDILDKIYNYLKNNP